MPKFPLGLTVWSTPLGVFICVPFGIYTPNNCNLFLLGHLWLLIVRKTTQRAGMTFRLYPEPIKNLINTSNVHYSSYYVFKMSCHLAEEKWVLCSAYSLFNFIDMHSRCPVTWPRKSDYCAQLARYLILLICMMYIFLQPVHIQVKVSEKSHNRKSPHNAHMWKFI